MGRMETFTPVPPAAVSRVLATFDRDQLAGFIAVAIDLLDFADGDPDVEEDDDSGQCDEDGINTSAVQFQPSGPGCEISDPGGEDAYGEDAELTPDYGIDQTECLPAAIVIASDRQNMRPHRDRIRRDVCDKITRYGATEYRLRD